MDNVKIKEMCKELWVLLWKLNAAKYTKEELVEIMLDEEGRAKLDDALGAAKGINGKQFKAEQDRLRKAELLIKASLYLEAQTLIRQIAREISAE